MAVDLNEKETKIFATLLAAVQHCKLDTHLRVAGGWVRDKLLGKQSHDIDIVLNNTTGQKFCGEISEYLRGVAASTHDPKCIPSNPEKSKHLETAKLEVFGHHLDFVNLRAETYASESRIPSMELGTPEQDAFRRDLTINSLFYNLDTRLVEDFTGMGLADLKAGIIRTPLPPLVTFLEDPLRVLRSIRFACRFGFELNGELKTAASSEEVKAALCTKVSQERIADEVKLMLLGKHPMRAMRLLLELGLFSTVFVLPLPVPDSLPQNWDRLCVQYMEEVLQLVQDLDMLDEEEKRISLLSAIVIPLKNQSYRVKKREHPLSTFLISSSLKFKTSDSDSVAALHKAVADPEFNLWYQQNKYDLLGGHFVEFEGDYRVAAGLLLKDIKHVPAFLMIFSLLNCSINERVMAYKAINTTILRSGLVGLKPLLNGNDIKAELGLPNGPLVKEWMDRSLDWQLRNPAATKTDCKNWLMSNKSSKRAKLLVAATHTTQWKLYGKLDRKEPKGQLPV